MLQQTRIETVIPYFERFMRDYPTVRSLAEAPLEDVLKHWEGLGYYSRARNLHKAALAIARLEEEGRYPSTHGFPDDMEGIRALPGIGDYTAGAIGAIAFSLPVTAVDGNVMRVVSRLLALHDDVMLESSRKHVRQILEENYPVGAPGAFVQGLMELGELICLPASPRCERCPVRDCCQALAQGIQSELPVRIPKTKRRPEHLRVLIIHREDGTLLLHRRPLDAVLPGLWELPNVPLEEDAEQAFQSRYGLTIRLGDPLFTTKHVFTHITWHMDICQAELTAPSGYALPEGWIFAGADDLDEKIMIPAAFGKILTKTEKGPARPGKQTIGANSDTRKEEEKQER